MTTNQSQFKQTEIGQIPENWEILEVEKFAEVIGGGTPSTKDSENFGGDIPWLTPRDLSNFNDRYVKNGERNITEKGLQSSGTKLLPKDSILLTSRAPVGYLAIAQNDLTTNQGFKSLVPKENADSLFLYYLLKNDVNRLKSHATGSTFQELSGSTLKKIMYAMPPLPEQKKIAEVLGTLDEKIELNRKMNKTLEQIGQSIFKQWFVDFENKTKWRRVKLGSFFPIKTGKKDANFSSDSGKYPFFTCSQGNLKADDYSFDCSALLLAGNGDFNIKWYEGKFEAYQRTYVLEPFKKELLGFLYFLIQYFLGDITAGHRGSVIHFLTKGMIEDYEIELPEENEVIEKSKIFYEILKSMDANKRQIETLSQIRDSLLPRLMTGRLRVN